MWSPTLCRSTWPCVPRTEPADRPSGSGALSADEATGILPSRSTKLGGRRKKARKRRRQKTRIRPVVKKDKILEELWENAEPATEVFDPSSIETLPPVARRYLSHALAPGALLSTCVRIRMTGSIRLGARWSRFEAEQVLRWDRGFVWSARAWSKGLPVSGFDRLVDGVGIMRWKLLGVFPVLTAAGKDIDRAAKGRLHAESIWMPAVLLRPEARWSDLGRDETVASIEAHGEPTRLHLVVDSDGALRSCRLDRWGDLETGRFGYHSFGGSSDRERTFDRVTIPSRHRVGWHFGTRRFEDEGEFFRCELEDVRYR